MSETVAGILILCDSTCLLLKRSDDLPQKPGTWCLPGGKIEKPADDDEAAQKEAVLKVAGAKLGGLPEGLEVSRHMPITFGKNKEKSALILIAKVPADAKDNFNVQLTKQHTESRWVPLEEIVDAAEAQQKHKEHKRKVKAGEADGDADAPSGSLQLFPATAAFFAHAGRKILDRL